MIICLNQTQIVLFIKINHHTSEQLFGEGLITCKVFVFLVFLETKQTKKNTKNKIKLEAQQIINELLNTCPIVLFIEDTCPFVFIFYCFVFCPFVFGVFKQLRICVFMFACHNRYCIKSIKFLNLLLPMKYRIFNLSRFENKLLFKNYISEICQSPSFAYFLKIFIVLFVFSGAFFFCKKTQKHTPQSKNKYTHIQSCTATSCSVYTQWN